MICVWSLRPNGRKVRIHPRCHTQTHTHMRCHTNTHTYTNNNKKENTNKYSTQIFSSNYTHSLICPWPSRLVYQLIASSSHFLPTNNWANMEDGYYWQIFKCQVGQIEAGCWVVSIPLEPAEKWSIWLSSRKADGYTAVCHSSDSACVSPEARTLGWVIEKGQTASVSSPHSNCACLKTNESTDNL